MNFFFNMMVANLLNENLLKITNKIGWRKGKYLAILGKLIKPLCKKVMRMSAVINEALAWLLLEANYLVWWYFLDLEMLWLKFSESNSVFLEREEVASILVIEKFLCY